MKDLVILVSVSECMKGKEQQLADDFNSLIDSYKSDCDYAVTTIYFNETTKRMHNCVPIQQVERLTEKNVCCKGKSKYYDAMGRCINYLNRFHKEGTSERNRSIAVEVLGNIGEDNSDLYMKYEVFKMIEKGKRNGWSFRYRSDDAANIEQCIKEDMHERRIMGNRLTPIL